MDAAWWVDYVKNTGPVSAATFVLGFLVSRFTLSKKEKKDIEQKIFENGQSLMEKQNDKFQDFVSVLKKYVAKEGEPTLDDFCEIATSGEKYFYVQTIVSEAILAGKVDAKLRDNTLAPKIIETLEKSLPRYYRTLKKIADKRGFPYSGKLERKNYESIYAVAEKYAKHLPAVEI